MIKIYPSSPGFTREWTVEFHFEQNGIPVETKVCATWQEAIEYARAWMATEVKL